MKATLLELLTSKKFLAAAAAIVVYLAGRFGWDVDPATLDRVFAALLVYVGAQGAADIGKSAAVVRANAGAPTPTATSSRETASGALALLLIGAGLALEPSCATVERGGSAGKHAVIECGKQDGPSIAGLLATFGARSAIAGKVDVAAIETAATGAAFGVGSCALAEFLREYKRLAKEQVAALGGEPDVVIQLQGVLARVSGGAEVRLQ